MRLFLYGKTKRLDKHVMHINCTLSWLAKAKRKGTRPHAAEVIFLSEGLNRSEAISARLLPPSISYRAVCLAAISGGIFSTAAWRERPFRSSCRTFSPRNTFLFFLHGLLGVVSVLEKSVIAAAAHTQRSGRRDKRRGGGAAAAAAAFIPTTAAANFLIFSQTISCSAGGESCC